MICILSLKQDWRGSVVGQLMDQLQLTKGMGYLSFEMKLHSFILLSTNTRMRWITSITRKLFPKDRLSTWKEKEYFSRMGHGLMWMLLYSALDTTWNFPSFPTHNSWSLPSYISSCLILTTHRCRSSVLFDPSSAPFPVLPRWTLVGFVVLSVGEFQWRHLMDERMLLMKINYSGCNTLKRLHTVLEPWLKVTRILMTLQN